MTEKKVKITESQFYQIVGLITAARYLRRQGEILERAYMEIIKEPDPSNGRFTEYVWEDRDIRAQLIEHLPHDDVIVKWNKYE